MIHIDYQSLHKLCLEKLLAEGFSPAKATILATIFTDNTRDGVISHGINRFPRFIKQIREKFIHITAEPHPVASFGAWEQWDGNHGPGPLNARTAILRAMELADTHGIGMVALRNTTHWMRGGTYGKIAAEQGYAALCWTNTSANMSPWGTTTNVIGNNPLVMAVPGDPEPIVLDMAMSQYSYGKMETLAATNEDLPYPGGFNEQGELTQNPKEILSSRHVLPIGMWKGAGLSTMLDLFASMLSHGDSTPDIPSSEQNCSQLFFAISPSSKEQQQQWKHTINHTITAIAKQCEAHHEKAFYPGEQTIIRRKKAMKDGMEIADSMIEAIHNL